MGSSRGLGHLLTVTLFSTSLTAWGSGAVVLGMVACETTHQSVCQLSDLGDVSCWVVFFKKNRSPLSPLAPQSLPCVTLCDIQRCVKAQSAALAEPGLPVPPSGLCTPRAGKSLSLAGALLPRVRAGRAPPTLRGVRDQRCPGRAGKRPGNAAPSPAAGCACWGAPACAEGFVWAFHPCELQE